MDGLDAMRHIYASITASHIAAIREGRVRIDPRLADMGWDGRRGLSLVVSVSGLGEAYGRLAERFRECEPQQYFYPLEDLHVTLFDFLTVSESYSSDKAFERKVAGFCGAVLARGALPASIPFSGVAFSAEAGILCGHCPEIPAIRDRIRVGLPGLDMASQERYRSLTAHATFMRFRAHPANPRRLAALIEAATDEPVGEARIASFDLVRHDWYNLAGKREMLASFAVKDGGLVGRMPGPG